MSEKLETYQIQIVCKLAGFSNLRFQIQVIFTQKFISEHKSFNKIFTIKY